jgi:adenosine deaminase
MFTKLFPKVELHCHLEGILSRAMLRSIRQESPDYPVDPELFEQAYPVQDYESFLRWYDFYYPRWAWLDNFYPILERYISGLKAQQVRYAEIMIALGVLLENPAAVVDNMTALREWVNQLEEGVIQVEFLAAVGRNRTVEEMVEREAPVLALHDAGLIVGVALAGVEQDFPVRPFQRTFDRFHDAGLGIEIHAGEWCGPESVWDALEYGHPDRIGHGVSLFQDARLVELFTERQIHIEMCPTSNLKTGSVRRIQGHPIRLARDLGLSFSVNTDDPGPFECSLESEYELLANTFGFDEGDWQRIYKNSLAARFQPVLRVKPEKWDADGDEEHPIR